MTRIATYIRASTDQQESIDEWIDEDRGLLTVELTRPFVEWIDLEAAERDCDSVAD